MFGVNYQVFFFGQKKRVAFLVGLLITRSDWGSLVVPLDMIISNQLVTATILPNEYTWKTETQILAQCINGTSDYASTIFAEK